MVMAALILFRRLGLRTFRMMPGGDKVSAYQVHSARRPAQPLLPSAGVWRMLSTILQSRRTKSGDHDRARHAILFYLTFFTLPLSGWVMWSSVAHPGPLYLVGSCRAAGAA